MENYEFYEIGSPERTILEILELTRISRLLLKALDRKPTAEEIGDRMDLAASRVLELMKTAVAMPKPLLGDTDDPRDDIRKMLADPDLLEFTNVLIRSLAPREELVLRFRFGVGDEPAKTRKEIARAFCVNNQRIGQIERGALRKCVTQAQRLNAQFSIFAEEIARRPS